MRRALARTVLTWLALALVLLRPGLARAVGSTIDTVLFADGLGRVVQTKKDADVEGVESMVVSGRVGFDHRGRAVATYYPTHHPKGAQDLSFVTAPSGVAPTRTLFDTLDRARLITAPDATTTQLAYALADDRQGVLRRETTTIDAEGVVARTYADLRGHTLAVQENDAPAGLTHWTEYAYDPVDQLRAVRDAAGNLTTIQYDLLGRRTRITSPDAGTTELAYDRASNLVQKRTAKLLAQGGAIEYEYQFNRLAAIHYPQYPENDVAYQYGAASLLGQPGYRVGRITQVSDESGQETFRYDRLGAIVEQIKTVASETQGQSPQSPEVYATRYEYDTWGRMRSLVYPDGERVTYRYGSGGLVDQVTGEKLGVSYPYVQSLHYDEFEQRARMVQGNGVVTDYAYDPQDRRLVELDAGDFQRLRYDYDDVGNILQLENAVLPVSPNELGGPITQTFQYDGLHRLKQAQGEWRYGPGKRNRYQLDLQYDAIHNLQRKTQTHTVHNHGNSAGVTQKKTTYDWQYTYAGTPHAPTQIGEKAFLYDPSGNQIAADDLTSGKIRTAKWDEENRLQEIADNGKTTRFKYDAAGQRIIKRGAQGETAYVNQFWTVRNRTVATKHIFVGETRVTSKLVPGDANIEPPSGDPYANVLGKWWIHRSVQGFIHGKNTQKNPHYAGNAMPDQLPEDGFVYFYHPDHLGSTAYVTDAAGDVYEHTGYFPHGETWIDQANSSEALPYLFTGKELDQETGLYYFGARYYDPQTALWQSADPALNDFLSRTSITPSQLSLYSYSYNNPIILKDPDGRETTDIPAIERLIAARVPNDKLQASINDAFAKAAMVLMVAVVETAMGPIGTANAPTSAADVAQGESSVTPGAVMFAVALKPLRLGKGMLLADSVGDAAKAASKAQKTVAQGAKVADDAAGKVAETGGKASSKIDRAAFRGERKAFWKAEAQSNPEKYSAADLEGMKAGRAPKGPDGHPMELHHVDRTPEGGVVPMSRTDHRLGDNYKKNHPD